MSVLTACTPRPEVLEGEMDDAIFAASLVDLVGGTAKPVYGDARTFFANTHPAAQLRDTARRVFLHLTDPSQGGVFIRLSTGFGGGKTHALMTLWHLAKNSDDPNIGAEIVDPAARPQAVTVVAVDVGAAGVPNFALHGGVTTHSLWGEVAFQLAGDAGLATLGAGEAADRQPNLDEFRALFPEGPVLILLDELVMYMANLRDVEQKALLNFINKLIGICTSRPLTALVLSDPATQAVYQAQTRALAQEMAAQDADQVTGRRATDIDPIGDESSAVIVRRLFESVDQNAAADTAQSYHSLYDRLLQDPAGRLVPDEAARDEYTQRIRQNYPFHPSLMRTVRDRLNTIPEFNSSRGTLRLFARLVRNVFGKGAGVSLISAGEVDWGDPAIVNDLLQRLNREAFGGAVNTDIKDHAAELDAGGRGIHTRVASALLLESLTQDPNAGFAPQELTLAVIRPEEAGAEASDAMERLSSQCWYTYRLDSGVGHQFRVEPNVNQMIAKRAPQVPEADALARVHTDVQGYFAGPVFKVVAFPANARQVQDSAKLQLALCDSIEIARKVASLANDENPAAEQPRQFRNAIVALAPSTDLYTQAASVARRLRAAEEILAENQGESGRRIREQLTPILNDLRRQLSIQSRRAFSNVVLADGQVRPIEEKYLVSPDEKVLGGNTGQVNLRDFLEQKMLIFRSGDRLDTDLYIQQVLTGSTPSVMNPGAYSGRSLHERLLSRPGMRLVPEEAVTRRSIISGVEAGRLVTRLVDGATYDATGAVVGPESKRERKAGLQLPPGFPLDDETLVAIAGEPVTEPWLTVTEPEEDTDGGGGKPPPPPPPPSATKTTSWAQAGEWAATRGLKALTLAASTPSAAMTLVPLAGPLGANALRLSVLCTGTGKNNGGTFAYRAENTGVNHPTQPLNTASTIYNSLEEGGRQFTARLTLDFGAGREGMEAQLRKTAEAAAEGVSMEAEFAAGTSTQRSLV